MSRRAEVSAVSRAGLVSSQVDCHKTVTQREAKFTNFVEWRTHKLVYRYLRCIAPSHRGNLCKALFTHQTQKLMLHQLLCLSFQERLANAG
jgi:hypothetical protein